MDWEAELAVVVGAELRGADADEAAGAIAGYTVANDVSMRDWQSRTLQWFQGKAFDATTPLGPVLVTPDEIDGAGVEVRGHVNGERVQRGNTRTLVFGRAGCCPTSPRSPSLRPGDVVLTGTPGGVGMGMTPPRFLADGDVVETEIAGIGSLHQHRPPDRLTTRHPHRTGPTWTRTSTNYLPEGDNSMYADRAASSPRWSPAAGPGARPHRPDRGRVRVSGVSIQHTPATKIWFGQVSNVPGYRSLPHHHGEAETGGYVLRATAGSTSARTTTNTST